MCVCLPLHSFQCGDPTKEEGRRAGRACTNRHPQCSPGPQEGLNHLPQVNQKPTLQLPQLINKAPGELESGLRLGWQEGCVRASGVPGSPRNPLPRHPHSSPVGSRHCYPHFRDERTEAQRVRAMCPELQSTRRELGFIPGHGMPCPGPRKSCVYRKPDTLPSGVSH